MILVSHDSSQARTPKWQQLLAGAIRDPQELMDILGLADLVLSTEQGFPLRVPRGYVARMRKNDPLDPLLLQVLPVVEEQRRVRGFLDDPVGDLSATASPGLLHKYQGRALLITTGACAIHCRYCFRRHFPYSDHARGTDLWQAAVEQLKSEPRINEIILSGGDPLSLSDFRLQQLVDLLEEVPHLTRLRIHTRLPVVLPERVTETLLQMLRDSRMQCVVVIHANHAQEIDADVGQALKALRDAGCSLLNQAVLLRDVNNTVSAQAALSEALFAHGVLPYYLHLLDKVQGAAHFEVPEAEATRIMRGLARQLPGYLLPRLVREIAGESNKTPIY